MSRIISGCANLIGIKPLNVVGGGGGVIGPCAGSTFSQCGPGPSGPPGAAPAPIPQQRRIVSNPNQVVNQREPITALVNNGPVNATVLFDYDSSAISSGELDKITRFAAAARQARSPAIFATGFASTEGDTEYNLALGQRRADAVAAALADQGYAGAVTATSRGESSPVMGSGGTEDRALSRRVVLSTREIPLVDPSEPLDPGVV